LIKKQTYTKTEAYKLYSRVFWIFLLNVIEIDLYNFELHRFKVGAFFSETQCILTCQDGSPCRQQVRNKLATSRHCRPNGIWETTRRNRHNANLLRTCYWLATGKLA